MQMKTGFLKRPAKVAATLLMLALIMWAETGIAGQEGIDPSQIKAGDYVCFGRYPQSSLGTATPATGAENADWVMAADVRSKGVLTYYAIEPIVWRVLEKDGDELLLLSEYILDCKPYNEKLPSVPWKDCTIRGWLNDTAESGSFISRAFGAAEKAAIIPSSQVGGDSPGHEAMGDNDTVDHIFFLSFDEADRYFAADADRVSSNTPYSAAIHSLHADYWWLRTPPGGLAGYAAYVSDYGNVYSGGHHVFYIVGVRPALRVSLSIAGLTSGDGTLSSPYSADGFSAQTDSEP